MSRMDPHVSLSMLERADGSASYSANGYKIICGVNGPMEVQRRDELPEEAAIEVNLRPASGVAGVRERHLESITHSTLRHIILTRAHPRTLIQVTLQIVASQEHESRFGGLPQAASTIDIVPSLFQSAMLALLSASIPLAATMTSVLIAINPQGHVVPKPTSKDLATATSVHVLAFSSQGELIAVESEGDFSMDEWEQLHEEGRRICLGDVDGAGKGDDGEKSLQDKLRGIVQEKIEADSRWKRDGG